MKFKLFETEIYISFLFAAIIAIMLSFDRTGYILPLMISIALHEGGHLFAMWIFGCAPKRIRLVPAAVEITSKIGCSGKKEVLIALSGPAVNLILFLILGFNYLAFKNESYLVFGLINMLIGIFNLMPVVGLDGGTIIHSLLSKKYELSRVGLIMRIINLSLAALVLIFAVTLLFKGVFNISFFIVALYLFVMSIIKI